MYTQASSVPSIVIAPYICTHKLALFLSIVIAPYICTHKLALFLSIVIPPYICTHIANSVPIRMLDFKAHNHTLLCASHMLPNTGAQTQVRKHPLTTMHTHARTHTHTHTHTYTHTHVRTHTHTHSPTDNKTAQYPFLSSSITLTVSQPCKHSTSPNVFTWLTA